MARGGGGLSWARIDDLAPEHPKVVAAGPLGWALYSAAIAYAQRHLTDGFIPVAAVSRIMSFDDLAVRCHEGRLVPTWRPVAAGDVARQLVEVGLWEERDGGYQIHDYLEYQESREEILARRAGERRVRAEKARSQPRDQVGRFSRNGHGEPEQNRRSEPQSPQSHRPTPTPIPQEPVQTSSVQITRGEGSGEGGVFDEFWSAYPRKVGKRAARAALGGALKRAPADEIISGARRLASDPNLPEQRFVPHPSTWLNRDGWDDEPLPPRADPQLRLADRLALSVLRREEGDGQGRRDAAGDAGGGRVPEQGPGRGHRGALPRVPRALPG